MFTKLPCLHWLWTSLLKWTWILQQSISSFQLLLPSCFTTFRGGNFCCHLPTGVLNWTNSLLFCSYSSTMKRGPYINEDDFTASPIKLPRIEEPKRGNTLIRRRCKKHVWIPLFLKDLFDSTTNNSLKEKQIFISLFSKFPPVRGKAYLATFSFYGHA